MANRPKRNRKVQISLSQPSPTTREPAEEIFSTEPEKSPEREEPSDKEGSPGNDGEGSLLDPNTISNPWKQVQPNSE